jgi:hypothetical protein
VNPLVLVVDDEPDVEVLFRRQFSLAGRYFGLMTVVLLAIQTLRGQAPQAVITNCCKNVVTISNDYRLGAHRGIVTLTLGLSSRRHDKKLLIVSRCQQLSGRSYRVSRSRDAAHAAHAALPARRYRVTAYASEISGLAAVPQPYGRRGLEDL